MICTVLKDLYYVELFVLRWMICTMLNDMYYIEWFVSRWVVFTTLNDLNYVDDLYSVELFAQDWIIRRYSVEWFALRLMICFTLDDLYNVEWFFNSLVRRRMICIALKDLYNVEWFGVRWMICTTLNHLDYNELFSIDFLMSARCAYLRKYCKIFYTNLWIDLFLIWKYQEEIYSALPQKLVIKRCFLPL